MTLWPALLMFFLLAVNVPIAISLLAPTLLYFFVVGDLPIDLITQRIASSTDSFPLLALPFFVLAGSIMNAAGITRRLLNLAEAFVGHFTGGLAQISVLLATMMGGLTASANADAAMLAKMLGPSMVERGYSPGFSAATVAFSSTIVAMIPPSIGMIVYAYLANISIGRLFIAGIVPGLLIALFLMVVIYFVSKKRGYVAARTKVASGKELWVAFKSAIWALSLPAFIIYGIRGGVFTPTEAGAIAVIYSIFVGTVLHRELSWRSIPEILSESVKSTATIMIIICGAATFGYYMVWENIPSGIAAFLTDITDSAGMMLLIINILLLLLGMVIEGTAAMILLTPILAPVIMKLGIDPIHFGVIMVFNITLGGVTPPVGTLLFTASNVLKVSLITTVKESLPLLFALLVLLALITMFPQISLFLPSILMPL